jgi:DNA-binding MarR family transcriptional regulator
VGWKKLSSNIALLVHFLLDGGWHKLSEVAERLNLPYNSVVKILDFLVRYGFLEKSNGEVRISDDFRVFIFDVLNSEGLEGNVEGVSVVWDRLIMFLRLLTESSGEAGC